MLFIGKDKKRFVIKGEFKVGLGLAYIIVDTVTGVNYFNVLGANMNGLTPLLDENGKPVVDK